MNPSPRVQAFFEQFERAGQKLDLDVISTEYANVFMFAGPGGTRVIEKQQLLAVLPKRQEFFKSVGHQWTRIVSLGETRIGGEYVMVRAKFLMRFQRASASPIDAELASTFILFMQDGGPQITFQLEDEDLTEALRRRGVLTDG